MRDDSYLQRESDVAEAKASAWRGRAATTAGALISLALLAIVVVWSYRLGVRDVRDGGTRRAHTHLHRADQPASGFCPGSRCGSARLWGSPRQYLSRHRQRRWCGRARRDHAVPLGNRRGDDGGCLQTGGSPWLDGWTFCRRDVRSLVILAVSRSRHVRGLGPRRSTGLTTLARTKRT